MEVKGIRERKINCEHFHKYFKEKYVSARYYDNNMKEFHEMKLGHKSMEEHVQKIYGIAKVCG